MITYHAKVIEYLNKEVPHKADQREFKILQDYCKLLPTMQDIKEMNEELAQTNKNFREESELYRDKFEANCEMVRRFDEVMVLKASKVSLKDEIMQLD